MTKRNANNNMPTRLSKYILTFIYIQDGVTFLTFLEVALSKFFARFETRVFYNSVINKKIKKEKYL